MRQYNDFEIRNVKFLVDKQVDFASIQITETGLRKSILDATAPVRSYLKENGIHNYEIQVQGPEHKQLAETYILTETSQHQTKTSLYRPITKKGDPRLWVNKVRVHPTKNVNVRAVDFRGNFASRRGSDAGIVTDETWQN